MEYIINCTFGKTFVDKQQEIISKCRKTFNYDNVNQVIENRQHKFITKILIFQTTMSVE